MSQARIATIDEVNTNGFQLATLLENFSAAVTTLQSGSARPAWAQQGLLWLKTGGSDFEVMLYDGTQDVPICAVDITNNITKVAGRNGDWNSYVAHDPALADTLNFVISGANAARLTSTGLAIGVNAPSVAFEVQSVGAMRLPVGTSAQRPTGNTAGHFRLSTTLSALEFNNGSTWVTVGGGGGGGGGGGSIDEEQVQDWVNDLLVDTSGATGIAKTYNDGSGTLELRTVRSIASMTSELTESGTALFFTDNRALDAVGPAVQTTTGSTGITATFSTATRQLSLVTARPIPANTDDLAQGSTNLFLTNTAAHSEIATIVRAGDGIVRDSNGVARTLTISASGTWVDARARAAITTPGTNLVSINASGSITTDFDLLATRTQNVVSQTFSQGDGISITAVGTSGRQIAVSAPRITAIARAAITASSGSVVSISSGTMATDVTAFRKETRNTIGVGAGLTKTENADGTLTLNTVNSAAPESTFAGASDTEFASLADGNVAVYESSSSKWKNRKLGAASFGPGVVRKAAMGTASVGSAQFVDAEVTSYVEGKIDGHLTAGSGIAYSAGQISMGTALAKAQYSGLNVSVANNSYNVGVSPGSCGAADGSRLISLATAYSGALLSVADGTTVATQLQTWYYVHLITADSAPTTGLVRVSTSAKPGTIQSGHTYGRMIGVVRVNEALDSLRGCSITGGGAFKYFQWNPTVNAIHNQSVTASAGAGSKEIRGQVPDPDKHFIQGAGGTYGRVDIAGEWYGPASGDTFDYGGFTSLGGGGNFPLGGTGGNNFLSIQPSASGQINWNFASLGNGPYPSRSLTAFARVLGFEFDLTI